MIILDIVFFFQAEDGIRDVAVTGVQTCALPIYFPNHRITPVPVTEYSGARVPPLHQDGRSEERRVGKSVDLGGRRIIKKKKKKEKEYKVIAKREQKIY